MKDGEQKGRGTVVALLVSSVVALILGPVVILMGRYDLHTPYSGARAYFDRISAPHKRFVTFERSAHN